MSNANAILVNHPGPLPLKLSYTPDSNATESIAFSGSIFTGDIAFVNVGFELKVDGKTVGKSIIHTHDIHGVHQATIPTVVNFDIPFVMKDDKVKPVTIELVPLNYDSLSTKDDFYNVTIYN